jgi:hypothetical protein
MAENQDSTGTSRPNGEAPADYVTLILDETGSMQDCKGGSDCGVQRVSGHALTDSDAGSFHLHPIQLR